MLLNSVINWSNAFIVTGLGILIVFIVLTLLVLLLSLSGMFFSRKNKTASEQKAVQEDNILKDSLSENEKAAIAMALYLYYEVHDEESYVITINEPDEHSTWNSKIYGATEY